MTRPAIQQWAGFYKVLGFRPLPLEPRDKKCLETNWADPSNHFGLDAFTDGCNLGIPSENGVVSFDDDCAKRGLKMGRRFLPPGGLFYGRASAPDSKAFYLSPELTKTHTWTD